MTIPLRHARLDVVRWTREADALTHLAAHAPGEPPIHVGEWHTDDRVSSIVARDLEGAPLWGALMAEGEGDPWLVPTYGGLLLVSRENLLLIDSRARRLAESTARYEIEDVLIGDTVVWAVGWHDALRVTGTGIERGTTGLGVWDERWIEGDELFVRLHDEPAERVGRATPDRRLD